MPYGRRTKDESKCESLPTMTKQTIWGRISITSNDAVFLWTFPSTGSFAVSTIGSDATIGLAPPSCDAEATSCGATSCGASSVAGAGVLEAVSEVDGSASFEVCTLIQF